MAVLLGPFLLQFVAIVVGAALFRRLARSVRQPAVIGEIAFGFLLGISVLGQISPAAFNNFFPEQNRPLIEALGWIGLILFIYGVGAELHWDAKEAWPIFFIAAGGLIVPFVLGSVLSLAAPEWFFRAGVGFEAMILMGCIMSVSALAVLGRLLADMNLLHTRAASLSLGASTIDDVVAWILLTLVLGTGQIGLVGDLNLNLLIVALLFGLALAADRFLAPYFARQTGQSNPLLFPFLLFAIFAGALLTHEAGLHALLGAFAVGAVISRHPIIKDYARTRLGEMTGVLFLPAFFVLMGMNVDVTILKFPDALGQLAILVAIATIGKVTGAFVGAKAMGIDNHTGLRVGMLLNNRGAVDLVVAKLGFDAGLLSAGGFALVVMMIAVTTIGSPISLGILERVVARRRQRAVPVPDQA